MTASSWLDVLDKVIRVSAAHGHPELAHRLRRRRARLLDPTLRVLVAGEPNQGKSQLVNALVNAPVCAVDDDLSTTVPTVVRHADVAGAVLVGTSGRVPVPIERIAEELDAGEDLVAAEVGIPRALLSRGLELVDTPPDIEAPAEDADVVVLATEATTELDAAELDLLARARGRGAELLVALTKIDLAPRWRHTAERDAALLAQRRIPAAVVPVSSELRLHAARTGDDELNAESGFGHLVERLQALVAAKPSTLAPAAAATAVHAAVEELAAALRAAADPDAGRHLAAHRLEELRRAGVRTQTVLADDMADLVADLEYDLRDRARRILREIDRAFETADPLAQWEPFERWLGTSLIDAADANFTWLIDRCRWIADRAAQGVPGGCEPPPEWLTPAGYQDPRDDVGGLRRPSLERFTLGQKAFSGLRGSYGGLLMFGLITSLTVGLPILNPIAIGAGMIFGGRSIAEEGESRLRRRQTVAKAAAQRHVDDFFLRYGKESRDVLRQVHRGLRDHFAELATELQDRATAQAAARDRGDRELRRELEELLALAGRPAREIPA